MRLGKMVWSIIISLLFFIVGNLQAQNYIAQIQKIGIKEGLSSYNASSFFQDSEGYMWITTDYGLNRYDGKNIKVYTKEENGLIDNDVMSVSEDPNQMLWVLGGGRGKDFSYCIFDKKNERVYTLEDYLGEKPPFVEKSTQLYNWYNGSQLFCEWIFEENRYYRFYEYDGKKIKLLFQLNHQDSLFKDRIQEGIVKLKDNQYALFLRGTVHLADTKIVFLDSTGQVLGDYNCKKEEPLMAASRVFGDDLCIFCIDINNNLWDLNFHINWQPQKQTIPIKANWGERLCYSKGKTYYIG